MLINASEELIETLEDNQVHNIIHFNYSSPILSGDCIICIHECCHVPVYNGDSSTSGQISQWLQLAPPSLATNLCKG